MKRCIECSKDNIESKLYVEENELNRLSATKFYDEKGILHIHNSEIQTIYHCTNGHRKAEINKISCEACDSSKNIKDYVDKLCDALDLPLLKAHINEFVPNTTNKETGLTTDPTHPDLGHGADETPVPQNKVYLVLSEEERKKGFVRPLRRSYRHVGIKPKYPLRDLTESEKESHKGRDYIKYEEYPRPNPDGSPIVGRYWTQKQLDSGCGAVTTMGLALCETYARNPKFYGSTYCCNCSMHRPVEEFVWDEDGEVVGS